jgi:hypothetical protein
MFQETGVQIMDLDPSLYVIYTLKLRTAKHHRAAVALSV